jgi:hypothetical protein
LAAVAPLSGALGGEASGALILESIFIFIPAGICAWLAVQALIRGERAIALPTFLLVTFFSLVTLNQVFFQNFIGLFRVSTGVVFAALYCIPYFDAVSRRSRLWLTAAGTLWLLPVGALVAGSVSSTVGR